MKRSKIFLGVTTCLLAIAGVAAAKRYSAVQRWYITAGNHCVRTGQINCLYDQSGKGQCTFSGSNLTVYTSGSVGVAANCVTPLTYTTTID